MRSINSPYNKPTEFEIFDNNITIKDKDKQKSVLFDDMERVFLQPLFWFPFWHRYAIKIVTKKKEELFLSSYKKTDIKELVSVVEKHNISIKHNFIWFMSSVDGIMPVKDYSFSQKTSKYIIILFVLIAVISLFFIPWLYNSSLNFPQYLSSFTFWFVFLLIISTIAIFILLTYRKRL